MTTSANRILIIVTLVVVTLVMIVRTLPPFPLPTNVPPTQFSAERAAEHIRIIAQEPRPTGSLANAAARNYILSTLKGLGLETETQHDGDLENVVGRIAGTRSTDAVLLTAHLDSVAEGPGATDDGSGVAVLLETARALIAEGPMPNTVMFLFTDFEEGGFVGAKAFIANHAWARDVMVVIGFDAGGLSGPAVLSSTSAKNGWLIQQLAQADPHFVGSSAITAVADSGTDFGHAFKAAGFSGFAFDLYWDRRTHTPQDNIENLDLSSLQQQGDHALSLARHFGTLRPLVDPKEPDAVYFSLLRLRTVTYPPLWAAVLALVTVGIFSGLLAFGLGRQILTWAGMGHGMFTLLVGIMLAPLPGILLGRWGHGVSLRYFGRLLDRPAQVGIVVISALALTVLWYSLARRFRSTSNIDLTMGALTLMLVGMTGTTIVFPAVSFAFTWPLLLSLLACAYWFYWHTRRGNSSTVVFGLLISGVASIVILGPTVVLGLFDQMPLALLLLGVLCGFIAPVIYLVLGNVVENQE